MKGTQTPTGPDTSHDSDVTILHSRRQLCCQAERRSRIWTRGTPYVLDAPSLSRSAGGVSLLWGVLSSAHPQSARHDCFDRMGYGGWEKSDKVNLTFDMTPDTVERPAPKVTHPTGRPCYQRDNRKGHMMHWAFYSILWWTAALLVATTIYRRWASRYGPGLKSEFAALGGMFLTIGLGILISLQLGV